MQFSNALAISMTLHDNVESYIHPVGFRIVCGVGGTDDRYSVPGQVANPRCRWVGKHAWPIPAVEDEHTALAQVSGRGLHGCCQIVVADLVAHDMKKGNNSIKASSCPKSSQIGDLEDRCGGAVTDVSGLRPLYHRRNRVNSVYVIAQLSEMNGMGPGARAEFQKRAWVRAMSPDDAVYICGFAGIILVGIQQVVVRSVAVKRSAHRSTS